MLPLSRSATTAEIPIIDLHGLDFAGESDKREVAQAVAEACKEAGFYIVNHGIEPAAIADMLLRPGRSSIFRSRRRKRFR